jgi:hypothetical protein
VRSVLRIVSVLSIVCLPYASMAACDSPVHVEKKPVGLKTASPLEPRYDLTVEDRLLWRSVLRWCDECEERSKPAPEHTDQRRGDIVVYALKEGQYIVAVGCAMSMQQGELIFYKVTDHGDTIESRLLPLEQFYFISDVKQPDHGPRATVYQEFEQKGRFIRFTDPLIYGITRVDKEKNQLVIEKRYRGMGGCGLLTIYDVSGDCPKVVEFRGKTYCSANYVPPDKWKLYPAKVRAKWRIASNPLRKDWKDKDQCR